MRIAVFGATGTVGRALVPVLAEQHEVVAISRRPREGPSGVRWAQADAGDAEAVDRALEGIDVAYYLVHSLGSADFEKRDRVAAATVARVCGSGTGCGSCSTSAASAIPRLTCRATCAAAPRPRRFSPPAPSR